MPGQAMERRLNLAYPNADYLQSDDQAQGKPKGTIPRINSDNESLVLWVSDRSMIQCQLHQRYCLFSSRFEKLQQKG